MPDRLETVVCTSIEGFFPAGVLTAASGNYFSFVANSISSPFNNGVTYPLTAVPAPAYAAHATLINGCVIGESPIGVNSFGQLYTNYRVVRYRLELTFVPASQADTVRIVVNSFGGEEIPSSSAGSVNLKVMEAQPFARSKTFAGSMTAGPGSTNSLFIVGQPHKDLGKTFAEYLALPDTALATTPAVGVLDYVGVFIQELNGSNNAGSCSIQMKLTQDVIFYDLIQQIS